MGFASNGLLYQLVGCKLNILGRFTTEAEVDYVVQKMVGIVHRLREMR